MLSLSGYDACWVIKPTRAPGGKSGLKNGKTSLSTLSFFLVSSHSLFFGEGGCLVWQGQASWVWFRRTRLQLSLLTCLPFNLIASLRERTPLKWRGLSPASSSLPLLSEESAVPTGGQALPDSKRPRRSLSPDGGLQSSQPLLYGLVSNCSEEQCRSFSAAAGPSESIGHGT